MSRTLLVLFSINLFFISLISVYAADEWISAPQQAANAIGSGADPALLWDPTSFATESIRTTAASYPDSPASNAAMSIWSSDLKSSSSNVVKIITQLLKYFILVLWMLIIFGGVFWWLVPLWSNPERAQSIKQTIQKITLRLSIFFVTCIVIYFCFPIIFA